MKRMPDTCDAALSGMLDLTSLPGKWAGREGGDVLRIMAEAAERALPLRFVCASVVLESGIRTEFARIDGVPAGPGVAGAWLVALQSPAAWPGPGAAACALIPTPLGDMYTVRVALPGLAHGDCVWFGTDAPDFPSRTGLALLQAAATLAAGGMQSARLAHERLRESRAKDEFLAMLGHELRNPLAPIAAAAEALASHQLAPEQVRRSGEVVSRQVAHMSRMLDGLLDISRVTTGLIELDRSEQNLALVLEDALEQTAPSLRARQHCLTALLPPEPLRVLGDAERLVQIFANLLGNAIKYTPPRGRIELDARIEDGRAVVTVADNGIGMARAQLPAMFDLYAQARRSQGGIGLGLALVRHLVLLHDGTVTAHSDGPGTGMRITVSLPLAPLRDTPPAAQGPAAPAAGASAAACRPAPAPQSAANALRNAIVDDNQDAAQMLAMVLESAGHAIAVYYTPDAALAGAAAGCIDVFLLDLGLPGMDGAQLACRLREAGHEDAQFMAVTGYGAQADRLRSHAAGFQQHFVKPVDIGLLLLTLSAVKIPA